MDEELNEELDEDYDDVLDELYDEAFDATLELVSATLDGGAKAELSYEGGQKVMDYFWGIYDGMCELIDDTEEWCDDECCCDDDCCCEEGEKAERSGKFEIKKTDAGYSFNLKAPNGEIIATSEVYTSKEACLNGIASVQRNSVCADVVEL